jgi:hypothetical protein
MGKIDFNDWYWKGLDHVDLDSELIQCDFP